MNKPNINYVTGELEQTIQKLNYYLIYKAIGVPTWNIYKKYKIRRVVGGAIVCMWGQLLMTRHPERAETTYYYAQLQPSLKKIRKHFKNKRWHAICRLCCDTSQGGTPNYTNMAQHIISKTGLTKKTREPEGYDDAEKRLVGHLTQIHECLDETIKDADLSHAEIMLRDTAVGRLRLRRIDGY
jgi:hypothetical protein